MLWNLGWGFNATKGPSPPTDWDQQARDSKVGHLDVGGHDAERGAVLLKGHAAVLGHLHVAHAELV